MDFLDRRFGGPPDATVVSARPDPPALGDAHAAHFHAAHFYESDESLVRTVGEFLLAGIAAEAPLIMVATAEHLDQVSRYLEAAGVDVEAAHRADRLVRINAGELLDLFMVESLPDAGLFNAIVGGILDTAVQAGKGRAAPRAYGEMVDVLWRAGNPAGAIALEQLWERLLTEVPCHLLCAYSLEGFQGEADGASFDQVCRLHGQIVPAAGRDEAALVRKVQRLERQARLFEQELVRRRELEEALRHALARSRRAEEELTNLVEHSVEGLYWVGPGGAILWANQAQLDLLGYARDEYVGRDVRDFHADAAERDTLERLERLARGDTVPDFEARLRCKDGLIRHVLIHSSALVEDGRFIHTRCFTRDITDRKIAEETTRRLSAIVSSSDDAIVSKDLDGIIQSWNPAAERLFGYTAAEAIGRSIRMIVPASRQSEEDHVLDCLRRGITVDHFETTRVRGDGTEIPISVTISPVRDGSGRLVGASKIARDITQRKQLEAQRDRLLTAERAARVLAEQANHAKDEFLALVSHELRTPLNAILGWTQILKTPDLVATSVMTRRAIDVIERSARQQAHLIEDLLDVSRIVSGNLQLTTAPVELRALVGRAVDDVRPAAEAKGLLLVVNAGDRDRWMVGDAARLQQVVGNLLSNALRFTPRGGRVQVTLEDVGGSVRVIVSDTGQGIAPEFLPYVFDRFRQADEGTSRHHGGLGLGLAVVRLLVAAHGGMVEADSAGPGLGSVFTVTLPVAAAADRAAIQDVELIDANVLRGIRILAVDDDPDARDMIRQVLEMRGAEIESVGRPEDVLQALEGRPFDVLLADIGLPGQDGYGLIDCVRRHTHLAGEQPFAIAVTAYAGDAYRARALAAGFDGYLTKPVAVDSLVRLIAEHGPIAERGAGR